MGKGTYLGGSTVVYSGDFGFTPLPEGGEKLPGKSPPTANQLAAQLRSEQAKKRLASKAAKLKKYNRTMNKVKQANARRAKRSKTPR